MSLRAVVLMLACLAAGPSLALDGRGKSCAGYALSLPFDTSVPACDGGACERDVQINDSPMRYCGYDSPQTVTREGADEPLPELSIEVSVEMLPKAWRADDEARRSVGEFLLLRELGGFAMWPTNYTISDAWIPPDAALPLHCRSVAWGPGTGESAGDETISCLLVDEDRILRLSIGLVASARARRDDLLASLASIHHDEETP